MTPAQLQSAPASSMSKGHATKALVLGAVACDSEGIAIWEGFKAWFIQKGLEFDFVLYSHFERQVEDLLAGKTHIAWNSPLAWVRTARLARSAGQRVEAIAMRDTDRDLTSVFVARTESAIDSIDDLRGKTVAVGAVDSPQATLIPLLYIRLQGLVPEVDFEVRHFDVPGGKDCESIGGERDAAHALMAGEVDAACMLGDNHLLFLEEGILRSGMTKVFAQTGRYDHYNFTAGPHAPQERVERFRELLLSQSYDDPAIRPLFDLAGLKAWKPGRTEGYAALEKAVDEFGLYDQAGNILAADRRSC